MPDDLSARRPGQDLRGRNAERPQDIPAPGWKDVLWRAWRTFSENNLFLVAGGVTYAILLALFPGLAALVSLYGLLMDPRQIENQIGMLGGVLPDQTLKLLSDELHQLAAASTGTLGISAAVSIVLALWTASRGVSGLITALNIAYDEKERRGFFRFNLIALGLTFAVTIGGLIIVTFVAVLPAVVKAMGLGGTAKWLLLLLEWPALIAFVLFGLAVLYRLAPDREAPQWRWVSPGAIIAAALWLLGSVAFTVYVANFASYDKTYGSLGGLIVLLTWLYLSSVTVLLGAVINAQLEQQTRRDTTVRGDQPMGRRRAHAADTLGESTD
jgi:membrane protein